MKWGNSVMKSKTLSSNKILMKYFTGTIFWITFAYTLVMFILVPVALFVYSKANELPFDSGVIPSDENILFTNGGFQLVVSMLFAAMIAVMLFNFKNKEASSDYIHGLPIKRGNIFMNAITVGFMSIVLPLIIVSIIAMSMSPFLNLSLTISDILEWFLFTLIVQIIIFTFSLFVGLLVNSLNLHIEMIVMILFLPLTLIIFVILAGTFFFNGVPSELLFNSTGIPQIAFPVFAIEQMITPGYEIFKVILWIIGAFILFVGSYFLYKYRHNERVNEVFNFNALYHITVILLTLLGMLIFGLIFTVILPISIWFNVFMFIMGALVSYILASMFMQDSVRVKMDVKNIVITLVSIALFWTVFIIGWKTYVNYIPDESKIESVKVVDWNSNTTFYQDSETEKYMKQGYGYSPEKVDIDAVTHMHKILSKESDSYSTHDSVGTVEIHYLMDNGKKLSREYKETSESIKKIRDDLEKIDSLALTTRTDFLYNLKNNLKYDQNSLQLFYYYYEDTEEWDITSKKIEALQKSYIEGYQDLNNMNLDAVKYTGKLNVEVTPKDSFTNLMGVSSIYNPAISNFMKEERMSLTHVLSLEQEYMGIYKVDLTKVEDKKELYKDLNYMSSKELHQKYEITLLKEEAHDKAMEQLENFQFDTEGNTLLIVADKTALEQNDEYPMPFTMNVVVK